MKRALGSLFATWLVACGSDDGALVAGPDATTGDAATRDPQTVSTTLAELSAECRGDEECAEPDPSTIVLDDEQGLGILAAELDGDTLTISLEPGSPLPERIVEGKVLFRQREERKPFIRRVLGVKQTGDTLVVNTKKGRLRDAFRRGRLRRTTRVTLGDAARAPGKQQGALGFACDFEVPLAKGPKGSIVAGLRDCAVTVDLDVKWSIDWGLSSGDGGELTATGTIIAGTTAYVEAEGEWAAGKTVLITSKKIPVIGPFVTVDLELYAGANLVATADASASAGFDYEGTLTAGIGYEIGDGVYSIWDPESTFDPRPASFEFNGTVAGRVSITPRIAISAFDSLEGYVEVELYKQLLVEAGVSAYSAFDGQNATLDGSLCYEIGYGVEPTIGAEASVLGLKLGEATWTPAIFYEAVENACVEFGTNVETNGCTPDDDCITAADCKAIDACHVPSCNAKCLCEMVEVDGCCITDADCAAGSELSGAVLFDCVGNTCVASTAFAGCQSDAECDDDRPLTSDKCEPIEGNILGLSACRHELDLGTSPKDEPSTMCTPGACDDGNPDTTDSCLDNSCSNVPKAPCGGSCFDGNPATKDICNLATGTCSNTTIGVGLPGK